MDKSLEVFLLKVENLGREAETDVLNNKKDSVYCCLNVNLETLGLSLQNK